MGYTDPEQFDAYLAEYLQTEEAVQIINDWISEVMQNNGNIEITSDQLTALATELSNGYLAYVIWKALAKASVSIFMASPIESCRELPTCVMARSISD